MRTRRSPVKNKTQQRGKKLRTKGGWMAVDIRRWSSNCIRCPLKTSTIFFFPGKRVAKCTSSKSNGQSKKTIDRKLSIPTKQKAKKAASKPLRAKRAGKRVTKNTSSESNGRRKMPIARKLAMLAQPKAHKIGSQTLSAKKESPVAGQTFHQQNLPHQRHSIELAIDRSFGVPPPATVVQN